MMHRTGCRALRHHASGNANPWQHRPSDHIAGNRRHVHGALQPMREPGLWARIFGR